MSLVGGYHQSFHQPASDPLYASYYQPRFETHHGASPDGDSSTYLTWSFSSNNNSIQNNVGPTTDHLSPDPYNPYVSYTNQQGDYGITASGSPNLMQPVHHVLYETCGTGRRPRVVKKRNTANKKERRRTISINTAFSDLRDCIPNVPSDTKLSKIKTLRLATSYIAYLMGVLSDDPNNVPEGGFKAEITKKLECQERRKREMALMGAPSNSIIQHHEKKTKGRTGWPQHVWALELKPSNC